MIAEALAARQAEIGRAISRRIVEEIPEYARAPEDVLEDLIAGATVTVGLLASAFAGHLTRDDLAVIRDLAARRVHQGISLEAFLHAYRVALFAYWDACAEEAMRADVSRDSSLDLARQALEAMDLMTSHAAEGYLREQARMRLQSGRRSRDAIERLLRGQPAGVRLPGAFVTIVGQLDGEPPDWPNTLMAVREDELVIIAGSPHGLGLERYGRFGFSTAATEHTEVPRAYREATLALSYTSAQRPVVRFDELSAFECLLVGADATTRAVIAAGPGLDEEDRQTVSAFAAADLNVTRAAQALHVHPNTIRYRLDRIHVAAGVDPRTFAGLVELTVRAGLDANLGNSSWVTSK